VPTPPPERLAERMVELIGSGGTDILLAGDGPDGIVVLRFQPSIWSDGDEAYVAELYVIPERRREGHGSELMTAALDRCRERGCDYVFLGTDEGDADAHRLYERFGFTNRSGSGLMYVYEREL
jgi:ribosomal protein S18 acetylase RimI-like enzyme